MDASYRQLQILVAIGQTGSMTRAAERLGCTQPAVSQALRELESVFGGPLFQRTTRLLSPTAAGTTALSLAERLISEGDEFEARVRAATAEEAGQLTFAATAAFALTIGPRVIQRFRTLHPEIRTRMLDVAPETIAAPVLSGEAAFSIGTPMRTWPEITIERVVEDTVSVITWPDGPFATRQQIRWDELADAHTISVSRGGGIREVIDGALSRRGGQFTPDDECRFLATGLAMVRARLGVLVLPSLLFHGSEESGLLAIPLIEPVIRRPVSLLRAAGRPLSSPARELIDEVKRTVTSLSQTGV